MAKNTVEIILSAKDRASKVTQKALGTVSSSASSAMATISKGAVVAAGAMATLSGVVGKIGLNYNAMKEQSAIAWETILKSQVEAKKTLQELQVLGAKTPFEFEGLDKAAKLLTMAKLGGDNLTNSLTNVGDAVAAIGGNQETLEGVSMALFQMQAKGKVQAEEMLQLAERGLPVWDMLAEKMGKSPRELMEMASKGELLANETVPLLVEAFGDRFGGAMEKQSSTFNGLMSTMSDNAKILAGVLTEGLFERVKGYLPQIIDMMERFTSGFQAGGLKGVMEKLLPPGVADTIVSSIQLVKDTFSTLKDGFIQGKDEISGVLETIKGIFLGYVDYIRSLFSGDGNVGQSFIRIFNVVKSIAVPILQDAVSFIKGILDNLKQFWDENGAQIVQAVQNFWSVIASIFEFIAPVILFVVKMVFDSIKGVISGALDVIMGLIKVFSGLFTGDFSKMWEGIKQLFFGAIEFIWNLINLMLYGRILSGIKAFGSKGVSYFKDFWTKAVEVFKNLDTHIVNIVNGLVTKVLEFFKGYLTQAKTIFETARAFGVNIFTALKDAIINVAKTMVDDVIGKVTTFKDGISTKFSNILSKAQHIFAQIKNAITEPVDSAKDKVLNVIETIKDAFSKMKIKIPDFKLPHISVSMKKGIGGIPYPGFNVDWYDKGGVFYGPQIIGVGEKRPEFVGALDDLYKIVRSAMKDSGSQGDTYGDIYVTIPPSDIQQMQDIIDFFKRLLQAARAR